MSDTQQPQAQVPVKNGEVPKDTTVVETPATTPKTPDPAATFDHPAALEALLVSGEKVFGEDKKSLVDRVRQQLKKQTSGSDEILIGVSEMGELLSYLKANPEFINEIENGIVSAKARVLDLLRSDGPAYKGSDTYSELFKSFVAPVEPAPEEQAPSSKGAIKLNPKTSGAVEVLDPQTQRPAVGTDNKPKTIAVTQLSSVTQPEKEGEDTVAYATVKGGDARYLIKLDVQGEEATPLVAIPFSGELATKLDHYDAQAIRRIVPQESVEVDGETVTLAKGGFVVANVGKAKDGQDPQDQLLLFDSRGMLLKIFDVDRDVQTRVMGDSGKEALAE